MNNRYQSPSPVELMEAAEPDGSNILPWGALMYAYVHKALPRDWKTEPRRIPKERERRGNEFAGPVELHGPESSSKKGTRETRDNSRATNIAEDF